MNVSKYPWLLDLSSAEAQSEIRRARDQYQRTGAVVFHNFITDASLAASVQDARARQDDAFTTDDTHTAYLKSPDLQKFPRNSVYNHEMRTQVASIAFDELPTDSQLAALYRHPTLLQLVSSIVQKTLYLSEDPLGCCSINVFRPNYHHSFHFDESEFSTTLMLQQAEDQGLFQYTHPLRKNAENLVLSDLAAVIRQYDDRTAADFVEWSDNTPTPVLHTLDFRPGTLSIFSGCRSLHRVSRVQGNKSRLVAVLTFASRPHFCNSARVQELFWGRSVCQK